MIWQLFRLNREKDVKTSPVLWIPTLWIFIGTTRNLSEWFRFSSPSGAGQYLEGNPLDQIAAAFMLAIGLGVLIKRSQVVIALLRANLPILLFFLYCGVSVLWSDFPEVSVKRWLRAVGDVVMVLIVLSDPNWLTAVRRLFSRIGFVSIPLSILFIRYYPELGRAYTRGGLTSWSGVATGKNGLGMICLVFGLASLVHFLQVYRERKGPARTKPLIAEGAILVMAVYLLLKANSATSLACFFLAIVPMAAAYFFPSVRKSFLIHVLVFGVIATAFSALFLHIGGGMVQSLGRDSTLTGRTDIWRSAFSLVQNPIFGTGFESFWLGPRLARMEVLINQSVNQAHDGYIEIYLNLGWIGVILLLSVFVTTYRRIVIALRKMTPVSLLGLTLFVVNVAYNFTEAAFKMMHPLWIALLLVSMAVLQSSGEETSHTEDPGTDAKAALKFGNSRVRPDSSLRGKAVNKPKKVVVRGLKMKSLRVAPLYRHFA